MNRDSGYSTSAYLRPCEGSRKTWAVLAMVVLCGCLGITEPGECTPGSVACGAGCCLVCTEHAHCEAGDYCCGGMCKSACDPCRGNEEYCPDTGVCTDLSSDFTNCGDCGNSCVEIVGDADTCRAGRCVCGGNQRACAEGFRCCSESCIDVSSSHEHCGECGNNCGMGRVCVEGHCEDNSANICGTLEKCETGSGVFECANLQESLNHCGACRNHCLTQYGERGDACVDGTCGCSTATDGSICPETAICGAAGCEDAACTAASCGLGCCDQGQCQGRAFLTCGVQGEDCVNCSEFGDRADACSAAGECVCNATGFVCPAGGTCTATGCETPTVCNAANCQSAYGDRADSCSASGNCVCAFKGALCAIGERCGASGCLVSCDTEFHWESNTCVSDTRTCDIADGRGMESWTGSDWSGDCHLLSCNTGFHADYSKDVCVFNTRPCTITNGTGTESWTGSDWSDDCRLVSCNIGFHEYSNACVYNTRPCPITNGTGTESWTASGWSGDCSVESCNTNYKISGNLCLPSTIPIYRYYHPTEVDHLHSLYADDDALNHGYRGEGVVFRLLQAGGTGTVGLYRCELTVHGDHFVSLRDDCEGQNREGLLGYAYTSEKTDTRKLYRCRNDTLGNHLVTTQLSECTGYQMEVFDVFVPTW